MRLEQVRNPTRNTWNVPRFNTGTTLGIYECNTMYVICNKNSGRTLARSKGAMVWYFKRFERFSLEHLISNPKRKPRP